MSELASESISTVRIEASSLSASEQDAWTKREGGQR